MVRKCKFRGLLLALPILLVLMCGSAFADGEVTLYAEGAYTATELKVYVYANATEALVSFGVKLTYDPTILVADEATCLERNNKVWYFGTSDDPLDTPNAGPTVNSTAGTVTFVGGKIDSSVSEQTGVASGERILLGIVTFTNNTKTVADLTTLTDADCAIDVALGKDGSYANFVALSGSELDGSADVTTDAVIHKRGDANGDGSITNNDRGAVKDLIFSGKYVCYADANDDGKITNNDRGVIRDMIFAQ